MVYFVEIMVFLWQSWYFCGNHGIFVAIMVSLWQAWYFCGKICCILSRFGLLYYEKSGNPSTPKTNQYVM
jgi:hypothetical protein